MHKLIAVLAIIMGCVATLGGALLLALLLLANPGRAHNLQNEVIVVSTGLLGIGFGLLMAWAGLQAYQGRPARPLRLPFWGLVALAIGVVLAAGQGLFLAGAAPLLPFVHVAAAVLPSLLFLSLVAWAAQRRGGDVAGRAIWGSMAWGALGGTTIGMLLEGLLLVLLVIAAVIWLQAVDPALLSQLQAWAASFERGGGELPDLGPFASLISSPLAILAIILVVGLAAPLIEEAGKALAVPVLALGGARLTRLDGYMIGLAGGAGFAALEGAMYGALSLSTPGAWAGVMALRGSTTAIHCLASALAGLGWQTIIVERRWLRGLGLGLLGVAVHGTWNVLAVGQTFAAMGNLVQGGNALGAAMIATCSVILMGMLWIGTVIALPVIAASLADQDRRQAVVSQPEPGPRAGSTDAKPAAEAGSPAVDTTTGDQAESAAGYEAAVVIAPVPPSAQDAPQPTDPA
jgi:RsiW-degrading membrane proteinase PrsW (M82 family)